MLDPGTRLGIYEVNGQLGVGGMGEVYRAVDRTLGREVAIKTLPAALAEDPDRLARFEREAKLLAALNHAHIAVVYGLDEHEGTRYIAMELVEGRTLEDTLIAGALPVNDALKIALQIAEALEAAHDKGVVHRDLKPANVMVTPDGVVKVLDFGVAKAFAADPNEARLADSPTVSPTITQQGFVLGTAGYMSPEQASGQATDQRTDVWAFGVVLYEMLTGLPPFSGESTPHILAEVLKSEPAWQRLPPNLHPRLRYLLERCLEKKPRDRYRAMADARVEIQKVLADPSGVLVQPPALDARAGKSRVRLVVALAVTLVVSALASGWVVSSLKPPAAMPVVRFVDVLPELSFRAAVLAGPVIAVSTDGTRVAYSSGAEIFVRDLDEPSARRLTAVGGVAYAPSFSPDGRWLTYADGLERSVYRIPVAGGAPERVVQDLAADLGGLAWDERNLLLIVQPEGIVQVSPDGGTRELLVRAAEGEELASPRLLPGADAVLFSATTASGAGRWDAGQVVVQSLASGERTVVLRGGGDARYVDTGHLVYAQGSALFAVPFDLERRRVTGSPVPVVQSGITRSAGAEEGSDTAQYDVSDTGTLAYLEVAALDDVPRRRLGWADRQGRREPIDVPPDDYTNARISPDGTQVALVVGDLLRGGAARRPDLWILNIETQNLRRLTFDLRADSPVWSADGSVLYFRTQGESRSGVYAVAADGGAPQLIAAFTEEMPFGVPWSLTPDGDRLVLFGGRTFQDFDLATVALDAPETARRLVPLLDDPAVSATGPVIAPNGDWMAYVEQRNVGIRPFPDVRRQFTLVGEGARPVFSSDGSELFYSDGSGIVAVPIEYEPSLRIGKPRTLLAYESAGEFYDPHPDGNRFLILQPEDAADKAPTRIHFVVNWFEELQRLVPTE